MGFDTSTIFDQFADKLVTANDKNKDIYVVSRDQQAVLQAALIQIYLGGGEAPGFGLSILNSRDKTRVRASYYGALRRGSGRRPEARMGKEFISEWLQAGDTVRLGRMGQQLFAIKLNEPLDEDLISRQLAGVVPLPILSERVATQPVVPPVLTSTTTRFARNPWIVAAALQRANGMCEMPRCKRLLFNRDDGTVYLEVHHVVPLSELGLDVLENVAALCPSCHRETHHGVQRLFLRKQLLDRIADGCGQGEEG